MSAPAPLIRPREMITTRLAKRILSGRYPCGVRLPTEIELSEELGVSRAALRESMRTLAAKGLIASRTRSGTVVRPREMWNHLDEDILAWREEMPPDAVFIRSVTEARKALEPAAAALAAERADTADLWRIESNLQAMCRASTADVDAAVTADTGFHLGVLHASHNPIFISFGASIASALRSVFRLTTSAAENYTATLSLHADVLEAIRMRRADEARQVMTHLLEIATQDIARVAEGQFAGRGAAE